jgi:4-hydroxybutyrate CoA-transferase
MAMSWIDDYRAKCVPAARAVQAVEPGNRVVFAHACGEPLELVKALVERGPELHDVEIVHLVPMGLGAYTGPGCAAAFRHNSLFVGAATRQAVWEGRADFTPVHFHAVPGLFRSGYLTPDVVFIHVSPPDEHGYCSFGVSVDYTRPAAFVAKTVVAQVNPQMPRTHGDSFIHTSRLDYVVETDQPIIELPPPRIGPIEEAIGRHVAALVRDGDCLQLGIGAIPDAVLSCLGEKNDLGIHTEMFSDGAVELAERGVITNAGKSLHRHKMVATFLMGTRRLYDFVDDNPGVNLFPVDHTNDPYVIGRIDNMVAINSAIEVDLMGQVVADTIGPQQYSGIGGQVDFVRGAARSKGGRSIIALPSSARGGTVSRIVARIADGAAITTMRADVDYVVTEHGVAHLKGRTLNERARRLIDIAHPDFRDSIREEWAAARGAGASPGIGRS